MANKHYSKVLMMEAVHALAKQYGWTGLPPDESRFSDPWVIGLICAFIVLATYLLFQSSPTPQEDHRLEFVDGVAGSSSKVLPRM